MVNSIITLNSQQLVKIEQIVVDQDEKEALIFLTEICKKAKANDSGCDPLGMRIREGLDTVVRKHGVK